MLCLRQARDSPQVPWPALAEMCLSPIRKLEYPPKCPVAIHCTIAQKHHSNLRCLPIPMGSMPATICEPSMLLMHPVMCISLQESSLLLALLHSIRDQWGVHSPLVSEQVVSQPLFSIFSHLVIFKDFAIWIIRCAASCWASSSSVRIAWIKLFTAEYSASAPCFSITVSSTGYSGAPENNLIVCKHQSWSDWKPGVEVTWSLDPILAFIPLRQHTLFLVLYRRDSSNIARLHEQCESWPLLDGFALDVKISYDTRWIFHRVSGLSRLVLRSSWVRLALSAFNKSISLTSVANVISSMTLLNVSATPGIVTTMIGSRADVSAGCPCGGVFWISLRGRCTELYLRRGYHSRSSLIIPRKSFCTIFTHLSRVFPHKIDCSNPIKTFSVNSLHIIAAATEVKVFPSPISSAHSAPGISASQTHLLMMNQIAQTWCASNIVPGRPWIEYLWPETQSSIDWRIGWAVSILTASSGHLSSNLSLSVLSTVIRSYP